MKLKSYAALMAVAVAGAAMAQDKNGADTYIWYDGGKPKRVVVDRSLVAEFGSRAETGATPVVKNGQVRVWRKEDAAVTRAAGEKTSPVLRDGPGGRMRALPGNIIVRLDPNWSSAQVDAWLASQGLTKIGQLPMANNLLVLSSPPGLASLELANRLQQSGMVISAQPDWWQQMERR
ncbi:hypothetical protein GCM10027343_24700 [Noviherbaspirillum agri]